MSARYKIVGLGVLLTLLPLATQAQQMPCGQHNQVVKQLSTQFEEVPLGAGLTPDGLVLELYASAKGTWTVLLTLPTGRSCLIAAGGDWNTRKTHAGMPGVPS
jgi:hypothetical protein